ncbi:MAG: hypothetical protein MZV70_06755 [Desulfobacterales bacterium]|nr:hypothetical protein [Desulfobacterales bacterium]
MHRASRSTTGRDRRDLRRHAARARHRVHRPAARASRREGRDVARGLLARWTRSRIAARAPRPAGGLPRGRVRDHRADDRRGRSSRPRRPGLANFSVLSAHETRAARARGAHARSTDVAHRRVHPAAGTSRVIIGLDAIPGRSSSATASPCAVAGFEPARHPAGDRRDGRAARGGQPEAGERLPAGGERRGQPQGPGAARRRSSSRRTACWRGIGTIPLSGLRIRAGLRGASTPRRRFALATPRAAHPGAAPAARSSPASARRPSARSTARSARPRTRWAPAWCRARGRVRPTTGTTTRNRARAARQTAVRCSARWMLVPRGSCLSSNVTSSTGVHSDLAGCSDIGNGAGMKPKSHARPRAAAARSRIA